MFFLSSYQERKILNRGHSSTIQEFAPTALNENSVLSVLLPQETYGLSVK